MGVRQKVFRSPALVRVGRMLWEKATPWAALCTCELERLFAVPESSTYWIETSTTQWKDRSGWAVWVYNDSGTWTWGPRRTCVDQTLFCPAWEHLDKMPIAHDRPTRIFFRLIYLG